MIIKNASVLHDDFIFRSADVKVENGKITEIGTINAPADVDLSGMMLLPGLTDIHIHGAMNVDIYGCSRESINTISKFLARHGVTSFLGGALTQTPEMTEAAFINIKNIVSNMKLDGAKILGINLEGLYINPEVCGAQRADLCLCPDFEQFELFRRQAGGLIKMVTVAPEIKGAAEFIEKCRDNGIKVSIGHTKADYQTATAALNAGAVSATHLYNAMTPMTHREPGVVGAIFDSDTAYGEIICDGIHVHPAAVRTAYRQLGDDRMILVSDSVKAAGMPDGTYDLGGLDTTVKDGIARSAGGNLAGSTTNLFDCVKKANEFGIPLESAVKMASQTPCKLIEAKYKGSIKYGNDADMIVVDRELNLCSVMVEGRWVI